MQPLYHELSVLAKSVNFKNLSAAALHVGLSQPQLSRIIARLEEELEVVLLDRTAKRKSGWTPIARQLADAFERSQRRLEADIATLSEKQNTTELKIGALEGLSEIALQIAHGCFDKLGIRKIHVDIDDLTEVEAKFLAGEFDVILTGQLPGRQKFKNVAELGVQFMEVQSTSKRYGLFSTFEFARAGKKNLESYPHLLVSNSLAVKKDWLRLFGGTATIPSEPRRTKGGSDGVKVLMVGSDLISPPLWRGLSSALKASE